MMALASEDSRGYNDTLPRTDGARPVDREATPPPRAAEPGWRFSRDPRTGASLGALNASVRVPGTEAGSGQRLRPFIAFPDPGSMGAGGYIDPRTMAPPAATVCPLGLTSLGSTI